MQHTPINPTTNVYAIISPPSSVVGSTTVRQSYSDGAGMISQDTICHVNTILVFCSDFASVRPGSSALGNQNQTCWLD